MYKCYLYILSFNGKENRRILHNSLVLFLRLSVCSIRIFKFFVVTGECFIQYALYYNINNTNVHISTQKFVDIYAVQQCYEIFQK